jgi:hypothetical protein
LVRNWEYLDRFEVNLYNSLFSVFVDYDSTPFDRVLASVFGQPEFKDRGVNNHIVFSFFEVWFQLHVLP